MTKGKKTLCEKLPPQRTVCLKSFASAGHTFLFSQDQMHLLQNLLVGGGADRHVDARGLDPAVPQNVSQMRQEIGRAHV